MERFGRVRVKTKTIYKCRHCRYEEAITCRAIFTDEKLHFDLKQNHGRDPYTAQYYGFWNNINNVRHSL